ncbi:YceI family protein [Leptospira fletcheri]|uniref:YceI family protein n=1 Tax=Leptospira fletcheri TaxID=2484981 RepID=A0A4R9GB70_9LEPT|nr:YceI family protein [Leptospira fletcheri]TGK08605.1 YceI family protein [Leptospira fletcheri]
MNRNRRILNSLRTFLPLCVLLLSAHSVKGVEFPESKLRLSSARIYFRSVAPQETIYGSGRTASGEVDPLNKTVSIRIDLRDFRTANRLRDSHLHDNYLETEEFPTAKYEGRILDFDPGSGKVKTVGTLLLHGKEKKDFLIEGILLKNPEGFSYSADFLISLNDFSIEIPTLLSLKLNEKIEIKTVFQLEPVLRSK